MGTIWQPDAPPRGTRRAERNPQSRPGNARRTRPAEQSRDAGARWQAIEIRHLAALETVARTGSFRRAADELGYVQSAISGQIAQLERAAGTRLLDRASGTPTVALTDAGRVLMSHTSEIMARLEQAYAGVSSLATARGELVRVAGLEQFNARRFARIVRLFRQRQPRARIALENSTDHEANLQRLSQGSLDLVVTDVAPSAPSLARVVLERDSYVLLVAAGCDLAGRDGPVSPEELASLRPVVPAPGSASAALRLRLQTLGIEEQRFSGSQSVATTQALVASGLGAAIVPRRLVDDANPRIATVELAGALPERTVEAVFDPKRDHSPPVYGLVRAATVVCKAHAQAGSAGLTPRQPERATRHRAVSLSG